MLGCGAFIELNFRYWYCFMEQYMMFQTTTHYFMQHLTEVGGMVEYLTEFVSMGFFYPMCAALTIALIMGGITYCFHRYLTSCNCHKGMFAATIRISATTLPAGDDCTLYNSAGCCRLRRNICWHQERQMALGRGLCAAYRKLLLGSTRKPYLSSADCSV